MISVEGLKVEFGVKPLFQDVAFVINERDRIALVGKNGAGKSTLAKAICQFITPEGDIRYRGQSIMTYKLESAYGRVSIWIAYDKCKLHERCEGKRL